MADPDYKIPSHPSWRADTSIDLPDVSVTAQAPTPEQATQTIKGNNDQWLRKWTLSINKPDGSETKVITTETANFDLRMKFEVRQAESNGYPGTATITIYNLKDETAIAVIKEFSLVVLQAGYITGHYGIIFQGTVKQFKKGKFNAIDSYLILYCSDADYVNTDGTITKNILPAGWTNQDAQNRLVDTMTQYGLKRGKIDQEAGGVAKPNRRPAILWGSGIDEIASYTASTRTAWSVQNGQIVVQKQTAYAPGDIVVINSGTGMIGIPEVTQDGIHVTSLLNPNVYLRGRVQLDNKSFNEMFGRGGLELQGQLGANVETQIARNVPSPIFATTANDGIYAIVMIEHEGDTRGLEWYTHLVCWSIDGSAAPQGTPVLGQQNAARTA